ncbi:MAG: hypothetical protein IJP32_06240, partial [Clostridia bacterium]|nr:hypothetical protein [Clostridia bacterium]
MNFLKRTGAVLMVIGLLASLFGCSEDLSKYGEWQSFSLHRTSSVMTDAYHYTVRKAENGEMTVNGFCYDEETEYRVEEEVFLPSDIAFDLRMMELESQPTFKPKKLPQVMDGAQNSASVTHSDGTERQIALSDEKTAEIVGSLRDVLKSAVQSASHGEWTKLWLSFTSDNYSEGYDFEVKRNDTGEWIGTGYCSDDDYNRYESENGIILSAETVDAIRAMKPERYAGRKTEISDDLVLPEGEIMLDGSFGGLTLGFVDGYTEEKATPSELDHAVAALLKKEFAEKA